MKSEAKFITIHGIDDVGKKSLISFVKAEMLRQDIDYLSWEHNKPDTPWRVDEMTFADLPSNERLIFNLGLLAADGQVIADRLADRQSTLRAGWMLDLLAAESVEGNQASLDLLSFAQKPDLAVLLDCSEKDRLERLAIGGDLITEQLSLQATDKRPHHIQNYLQEYLDCSATDCLQIDTSEVSWQASASYIVDRAFS
jgi:thymidylate kinase